MDSYYYLAILRGIIVGGQQNYILSGHNINFLLDLHVNEPIRASWSKAPDSIGEFGKSNYAAGTDQKFGRLTTATRRR